MNHLNMRSRWDWTLVGLLLVTSTALASDRWLQIDGGQMVPVPGVNALAPEVDVLRADASELLVEATLPGVSFTATKTPLGAFATLDWPDASVMGEPGAPALPVIRRLFVIPPGATWSLEVTEGQPVTLDALALDGLAVMPVQPPVEKLPGAREAAAFVLDGAAYGVNMALPVARASVEELGIVRGQRLALLEIYPVAYNAATGSVTLYPEIAVRVHFDGAGQGDDLSVLPGLERVVLNPQVLPVAAGRGEGNYLIIVAPAYETGIAGFASAKAAQGYTVATYVAPSGVTNTQLKAYIQSLWGTPSAPQYILLVGDTDTIPHWVGGGEGTPATDIQYGCMDGSSDWYPDIAVGRFPVRSAAQLEAIITKTLYYEANQLADPGYLMRAVFMASTDNYTVSEGTHNWCINTYMNPNGYTSLKLYSHSGATTQQVREAFNSGRFFGIYSGHGSNTYWADGPVFYQSDVNGLTNVNMYPLVCSFACVTGAYTDSECFMETWIRAPLKGAVIAWGSSVNSYWTEDDVLQRRLFDVMFDFDDNVVSDWGPIVNETKLRYLAQMGSGATTRRYFEMYNTLGDPATWIIVPPTPPTGLKVTPYTGLKSEGPLGGPYTVTEVSYVLENRNDTPLVYSVTKTQPWVEVSTAGGTLAAHEMATIVVSLGPAAYMLGNGTHVDTVAIDNLTDGVGSCTRSVELQVGVPTLQIAMPLDTNPGWVKEPATTANQWAFGVPTGAGGAYGCKDPNSGHTGPNVIGYNLAGDYTNSMPEYHITTGAFDCSNLTRVKVKFWRWLGVEKPTYDHARFRVSTDGTTWTTVWENTDTIADGQWVPVEYDLQTIADGQPTVYLRWSMGTTDSSWTYCGWNIDDLELWGVSACSAPVIVHDPEDTQATFGHPVTLSVMVNGAGALNYQWRHNAQDLPGENESTLTLDSPTLADAGSYDCVITSACGSVTSDAAYLDVWRLGDMNCDGTVDFKDINPFVEALSHPGGQGWNHACPWLNADCLIDGQVNFKDINAFVQQLGQ